MHRRLTPTFLAISTLVAIVIAAPVSARTVSPISASTAGLFSDGGRLVSLAGSVAPGLGLAKRLQPLSAHRQLGITVNLAVRDQAGLSRFLSAVYDPASPSYHHFLSTKQFAQEFGPTAASRARVAGWLKSGGLRVTGTSTNGLQVHAVGTVAAIQKAFKTPLYSFKQNAHTFFANSKAVRLPTSVAGDILGVSGLSSSENVRPVTVAHANAAASIKGYTPANTAALYDYASLLSQGINGSGQTVAIATFADYSSLTITKFDQQFGLSSSVTPVKVDGGVTQSTSDDRDETELDIEMVQGTAQGANVLVYETPNSDTSAQSMLDLYNKIVSDDRATVVTTSWGLPESEMKTSDIKAADQIFQEGAAQGQAFFAASGDAGAYDDAGNGPGTNSKLVVDYPASDPWVTGVGGTRLDSNLGRYAGESVWASGSTRAPEGSGGGLSTIFTRPSYQTGPGVSNSYSNGKRQVPDVAANADPSTGYAVFLESSGSSVWGVIGGTSAAAPLWAGFAAIVNQATGRQTGSLNPTLYALGQKTSTFSQSPYHDVTDGDNLYYPATAGWDFATGWGSFDGAAFVADVETLPSTPTVTPTPTATPVPPSVNITKVLLVHTVNGKQQTTGKLKVGEKGTLVILYATKHAGSLKVFGTVMIRKNGQLIVARALKSAKYQGKPALEAAVHFTSKKRVGTLNAQVKLTLGSVVAALTHSFKLGLK